MSARRKALLATVVVAAMLAAWWSWPGHLLQNRKGGALSALTGTLPAATIRVTRGGHATVTTANGTVALPETVYVSGGTPAVLRLENTDTVDHRLGFFGVPARSAREYTIAHPGAYGGYCTAHPAKRLTYIVR